MLVCCCGIKRCFDGRAPQPVLRAAVRTCLGVLGRLPLGSLACASGDRSVLLCSPAKSSSASVAPSLQFDDGDALVLLTEFFLLFLKDQF
jgi:hypothetical protein